MPGEPHDERGLLRAVGIEGAVARLAESQHGVAAVAQLARVGVTSRAAQYRVEVGRFQRWDRGVYVLGPGPVTVDGHRMAATLAAGDGAVLSHRSAAAAWGLLAFTPARHEVTVAGDAADRHRVRIHGVNRLDPSDVTELRGIPVTTVARTLVDLAGDRRLGRAFHEAEVLRLLDVAAVTAASQRVRGRPNAAELRKLIEGPPGAAISAGELEHRFRELCEGAGLPRFLTQHVIDLGDRLVTVDVVFPGQRVVVELDGERYHRTRRSFHADRERDAALAAIGYVVVRLTWNRVTAHGPAVIAQLRAILAAR